MFGRKKEITIQKTKNPTQREIMAEIQKLGQGEAISYGLPESYGGGFASVEFNTMYPWSGRKYKLSTHDGHAIGDKAVVLESDDTRELAAWVTGHRGSPYPADTDEPVPDAPGS